MPNSVEKDRFEKDRLELIGREHLSMTGVDAVDGFTDNLLNLTVTGVKVRVIGEGIKITSYNKTTGMLSADGDFREIKYLGKNVPLVKKIFK